MTIAIEDSYSGIQGSTSADIATIGYYDNRLPLFNAKANWKARSMQEVLNVIQSQHKFSNVQTYLEKLKIYFFQIEEKPLEPKLLRAFLCVKSYNRDKVGLALACLNINKIGEMDSKYPFLLLQFKGK